LFEIKKNDLPFGLVLLCDSSSPLKFPGKAKYALKDSTFGESNNSALSNQL